MVDFYGFECFKKNDLPQFLINCFNEQIHYLYLQRIFSWEALEMNEDDIAYTPITYYNNKTSLDQMLSKSDGVLAMIDEATKSCRSGKNIMGKVFFFVLHQIVQDLRQISSIVKKVYSLMFMGICCRFLTEQVHEIRESWKSFGFLHKSLHGASHLRC